jgi:hypothetical protein
MPSRKKAPKTAARRRAGTAKSTKKAKKAPRRSAKTKKTPRRQAAAKKTLRRSTKARKGLRVVAVGDAVKLPIDARNLIDRYDPSAARGARSAEAVEGIVCSIRTIKTGRLVAKTRGDLSGYVLEIIHSETFRRHASPTERAGAPAITGLTQSPVWQRMRELLEKAVGAKELPSAASGGLSVEPYRSLLNGWRVVKVKAELVEVVD